MREIKFRGKRIDNGEWAYGSYVADVEWAKYYIYQNELRGAFWQLVRYEVDEKTVGQFTSLEDKSEKRVYEGDIGIWNNSNWIISWNKRNCQYFMETIDSFNNKDESLDYPKVYGEWHWCSDRMKESFEIIGNITDNPKLLEDK